jgi:hypothetical protein
MEQHECARDGDPHLSCAGETVMRAVEFPAPPAPYCESHWDDILRSLYR